ncbi:hypothetical protein DW790_05880 [Firmicutes bacterium AM31-12AC]|nr:hypothetical protein DW790_05880 [Firmicutes bacterium AM31-12AC]
MSSKPRFEKCNYCRYGWNNPYGCNYPDPLDSRKADLSCYQPMTKAQIFQQELEGNANSASKGSTILAGDILSGYALIDTNNPYDMANYYVSEYIKNLKKRPVEAQKRVSDGTKKVPVKMVSTVELSQILGLSIVTIQNNCRKGLYPGATKVDGKWMIPMYHFQVSRK